MSTSNPQVHCLVHVRDTDPDAWFLADQVDIGTDKVEITASYRGATTIFSMSRKDLLEVRELSADQFSVLKQLGYG